MTLDDNLVKYLFSRKNIRQYITILFIIGISLFTILFIITTHVYDTNRDFYFNQLKSTEKYRTKDVRILCSLISCEEAYIRKDGTIFRYEREENTFKEVPEIEVPQAMYGHTTSDFTSILDYDEYRFVVHESLSVQIVARLFVSLMAILGIAYTYIFIWWNKNKYKDELFDKGNFKNYVENKSQRNITEMIHHEMGMPLAILRTLTDNMSNIMKDENNQYRRSYDMTMKEDLTNMNKALDRLDAILELLRNSKQIKNIDETVSIYHIIDNIVNTVKCFNIGKISVTYKNKALLDKYRTRGISNGMFLNMIQIMVNNSVEAKASMLTFDIKILSSEFIELFVIDNGRGIRDKCDKIIKNCNEIYKYGYSTKNKDGEAIISTSLWHRFLSFLGIRFHSMSYIRGIGLNLNKEILLKVKGDIEVVETSPNGTTFKLTIPVTKIKTK